MITFQCPDHVIDNYHTAAVNACYELQIDPYAVDESGAPAWVAVAGEMHKTNVLRKHMMFNGVLQA